MVSETLTVVRVEALTAADKSILINSTAVAVDECVVVCEEDNFYSSVRRCVMVSLPLHGEI